MGDILDAGTRLLGVEIVWSGFTAEQWMVIKVIVLMGVKGKL